MRRLCIAKTDKFQDNTQVNLPVSTYKRIRGERWLRDKVAEGVAQILEDNFNLGKLPIRSFNNRTLAARFDNLR